MTSERFDNAFTEAGGPIEECGFCGVTHFVGGRWQSDTEFAQEFGRLRKLSKKQPHNYIEHEGCDFVDFGFIGGKKFIPACACSADGAKGPGAERVRGFYLGESKSDRGVFERGNQNPKSHRGLQAYRGAEHP